jgi:hypothetical protein
MSTRCPCDGARETVNDLQTLMKPKLPSECTQQGSREDTQPTDEAPREDG